MIENVTYSGARMDEIVRLGKEGKTTLKAVADKWKCSTENIVGYLHRLQRGSGYAYLVDGKGYFKLFKELD